MNKITPFLWVDGNVEEMLQFYTSVFLNAQFNGVSHFQLSPAFSLFVNCQTQQEINEL